MKNRGSLLKGTAGKIVSPERGLINFLGPLLKIGLSFMKYLPMPLAKTVLITLGLTAAASAIDAAIQNIYIYIYIYMYIYIYIYMDQQQLH